MPPTVPLDHDCGPENQQNRTQGPAETGHAALFHYSMLMYSKQSACLEHSNLFKVNVPNSPSATVKCRRATRETTGAVGQYTPLGGPIRLRDRRPPRTHKTSRRETQRTPGAPKSNYELFNCNNFNIRYWSWNYRGCWHQTCPPIVPR